MIPVQLPCIISTLSVDRYLINKRKHWHDIETSASKRRCIESTRKPKKSVKFSDDIDVRYRSPYTQNDIKNAWYQDDEYKNIQNGIRSTIKAMKNSYGYFTALDVNEHCFRGLEHLISFHVFREEPSNKKVQFVRRQVLLTQNTMIIKDPETIQMVYSMLSDQHRCKALNVAAIDANI